MSMPRIYVTVSPEIEKELDRVRKVKGYLKNQDLIREILSDWYSKQQLKGKESE